MPSKTETTTAMRSMMFLLSGLLLGYALASLVGAEADTGTAGGALVGLIMLAMAIAQQRAARGER